MKDLDFDELDRAVSTLMNDVPKSDLSKNDDNETKTLSISPTLPDNSMSEPASAPEPAAPNTTPVIPQPRSVTPPATRRAGRFMDVVHHSSDMKKDKATSAQPTSRQGVTINPTKSISSKEETSTEVSTPASTPVTPTPSAPDPVVTDTPSSSSDWPDPLDVSTLKFSLPDKTDAVAAQPDAAPLLEEGSETPAVTPDSDDLQPLTTPFLSGTKVEKRPLGAAQLPSDTEAPEPDHTPVMSDSESQLTVDNPQDQLPANPTETKKDLPPELQGDLVAIESGSSTQQVQPQESTTEELVQPEPKPEASHPTALLEATTEDQPEFTGPTSIAQQYKEEPNTGDPKNGAIYDTDTYHKPLTHPAQKKSGWLWVIWILLILLIGAGTGAALYFLQII